MRFMTDLNAKSIMAGLAALLALPAGAGFAHAQDRDDTSPVVVELFMSQSCNSCPAAAEYIRELAVHDDLIVLSWHVDYWNMLNTKNGRWVDPYSQAAFTKRQRYYNKNIRHKSSVYTPQIIIGGVSEAPGFKTEKVSALIDEMRPLQTVAPIKARRTGDDIIFDIKESTNGGNAYLLKLLPEIETDIPRGENAGHTMKEANVITDVQPLGVVRSVGAQLTAAAPEGDASCAIIVQEPRQGRIVAAAYCP